MAKHIRARVLVDTPAHGLKVDQVAEGDPSAIKALVAQGVADTSKEAVEYALSQGAKVIKVAAAEDAAAAALAGQLVELEALAAASQGEERAAIEAKLADLRKA